MKNGEPIGTQTPTGHYVLLDTRFEPPPGITSSTFNRQNLRSQAIDSKACNRNTSKNYAVSIFEPESCK